MHVVILGCGRVGSAAARRLLALGHSVAIVDQDPGAFRRLGSDFAGSTVTGVGFDRDVLREAGIERAAAFAAVSSGDNSNIIAARVARENFGIDNVVARIYDPRRAAVYERLGIPTVKTVAWTADSIVRRLLPEPTTEWSDPSGKVAVAEMPYDPGWIGTGLGRLEEATGVRAVALTRLGNAFVPGRKTVLQDGDVLHVAVDGERFDEARDALATAPGETR